MTHHDDLSWLADNQPAPSAPTTRATSTARRSLVAHITDAAIPTPARAPRDATRTRAHRRWLRPSRILAATAVASVAAAALVVPLVGGGGAGLVPQASAAPPLVRLAKSVGQTPTPAGDATLVIRRHAFSNGDTPIDGADLYADNGAYYYAQTLAGLPAAIGRSSQQTDTAWFERHLAAALGALKLPTDEARTRMANASFAPGFSPDTPAPPKAAPVTRPGTAGRPKTSTKRLATGDYMTQFEGRIWMNSLDTLTAAGSRSDVRAGVLSLLATVKHVTVTESALDGQKVMEVGGRLLADGYTETLVINADTGIPIKFTGGYPGETPAVVVTYRVSRATVKNIATR